MKKIALCLGILASSTFAGAATPPVNSLNDLPFRWQGVAGDLLQQTAASFEVRRIAGVERNEGAEGFTATYLVDATLAFGARALAVRSIELQTDRRYPRIVWITLETGDELVPRLWAAVSYDEASDSYTLREMPRPGGERRFVLTAPARR